MRSQTTSHSGPHGPHLLQYLPLSFLAIVTNSIEVPLHEVDRETGTSSDLFKANIMISAQCRLGHEVGCSIPAYVADGLSGRSRKELLFPPSRIIKGQQKVNSLSRGANSRITYVSNSVNAVSSATITPRLHPSTGPNHKSDPTSLSISSNWQVSRPRPQGRRPGVEQIPSRSIFCSNCSSYHSSSHHGQGLDCHSSLVKEASGLSNQGLTSEVVSGKDSRQSVPNRQSLSINNFDRLSAGNSNGRMHPALRWQNQERGYPGNRLGRRLAHLSPHGGHDLVKEKSHQLLEDSALIPVGSDGPNINISNRVQHWKAPPLESGSLMTITVAQGGTADFSSIQKAVDSVPARNTQRVIIRIHAGNYREKVTVPYNKPFITFHGDENGATVVSWNATASSNDYENKTYDTKFARMENASSSLVGTMHSASVTILSDGFVAQHLVFQNSAPPPEPGAVGAQAVAFLIAGDRAAFYYCSFLGAQDTLYDYTGRHYYLNCYIQGSIDFIFGNGRSLFEECHLHSIAKSFGAIAAHQRLSPEDDTGFSFDRCTVTGSGMLYLGRAWSPYARIVFARTYFDNIISAEGWSDFGDPQRQSTTFFGQYQCTGPGANLSHRAPWAKLLTDNDALPYLGLNFVNGKQWLGTWSMGSVNNGTGT